MRKTIIVGNAPSVLLNKYGDKIDSFDRIIRMNDYVLEGYEDHVGSREAHVYARSHNAEYKMRSASTFEEIWLKRLWVRWFRNFGYKPFKEITSINKIPSNIKLFDPEGGPVTSAYDGPFYSQGKLINIPDTKHGPAVKTTGLMTIDRAIKQFYSEGNPIYIYGFTFFNQMGDNSTEVNRPHYYIKEPPNMYHTWTQGQVGDHYQHTFNIERDYVIALIEQGKVKPLFEDEIYKQLDFSHLEPCQEYIPDFLANKPRPTNRWAGQIYGDIKNND